MTDFTLDNKIALVNGASRGIGAEIAKEFARRGATVVLSSRKQEALEAVAQEISGEGGKCQVVPCHVGKPEQVDALFEAIRNDHGRLDVLVNNAATNPYFGPLLNIEEGAYDKTFEINCKGYFLMAQRAGRMMVEQESGSIINVSSIEGITPSPMMGVYSMTKSAVIMLTKVLAKELGSSRVRCNCICPGLVETRFSQVLIETPEIYEHYTQRVPMERHAQPQEIVGAAVYFASDAASYSNGSILTVDGGTTA